MLRERWRSRGPHDARERERETERETGLDVGTDKALGPTSAPRPLDSSRMIDVDRQSR